MQFVIEELLLWPRDEAQAYHSLPFDADRINVVHGRSGTGKSSIIAIIDYCLGASRCSIPVGIIRESVSWFGLAVRIRGQRVLLCRRTPDSTTRGKEFLFEVTPLEIPSLIVPNCSAIEFKGRLNALTRISNLPLSDDDQRSQFDSKASYRDLAAFNFLPQHIVANPNTLFFKTDTYEHRERLKRLLPLSLGIVDSIYAANERENTKLNRELEQLTRQRETYRAALAPLDAEVRRLWIEAVELGLCEGEPLGTEACMAKFVELQHELEKNNLAERLRQPDYARTNQHLLDATKTEEQLQRGVDSARRQVRGLQSLAARGNAFQKAVASESTRVINLDWLRKAVEPDATCIACGNPAHHLGQVLGNLEEQVKKNSRLNQALLGNPIVDAEIDQAKHHLSALSSELHKARVIRMQLEKTDSIAPSSTGRLYLLLGEIKATVATFSKAGKWGEQEERLLAIEKRLNELDAFFKKSNKYQREKNFDDDFARRVGIYAEGFDLEQRGRIELDKSELTLRFKRKDQRTEFLWEVGSGANWMGYHLSSFFALHEYLSDVTLPESPVFSFLVIDQPSQVYFPSAASGANELDMPDAHLQQLSVTRNHDVVATKKIFEMLEKTLHAAGGRYQIIVLEHADASIWGGLEHTVEVANWKALDDGLIPRHWQVKIGEEGTRDDS